MLTIPPNEEGSAGLGFDQVLFEVPPSAEVELVDVMVGEEVYSASELGIKTRSDSLWIHIPAVVQEAGTDVALRFSSAFYLASNAFLVSVGLGEEEVVWQRVDPTDAGEG